MAEITVKKERSAAIDMIKGLSILSLFFLHFENGAINWGYNYFIVRSPAFYMVVGWLWGMSSHKRTVKEHLAKRKDTLIMPYIWFSLIFLGLDIILLLMGMLKTDILIRDIYKTFVFRGIGTLWFLPALLGGELLFLSIRDRNKWLKFIVFAVCFVGINIYNRWTAIELSNTALKNAVDAPLHVVCDMMSACLYLAFAYYLSRRWGRSIFNMNRMLLFCIGGTLLIIGFLMFNFISLQGVLMRIMFMVMSALSGLGALFVFRSVERFRPIEAIFSYFGRNSLVVMVMHWFLFIIVWTIDFYIFEHAQYSGKITLIYFAIAFVILIGIIELINHKFKFLIGKK